jgi:hypothetical protein
VKTKNLIQWLTIRQIQYSEYIALCIKMKHKFEIIWKVVSMAHSKTHTSISWWEWEKLWNPYQDSWCPRPCNRSGGCHSLPTMTTQVQAWVSLRGNSGGHSDSGMGFLHVFCYPYNWFHRLLYIYHHPSLKADIIGRIVADILSGLSLTTSREIKTCLLPSLFSTDHLQNTSLRHYSYIKQWVFLFLTLMSKSDQF